MGCRLFEAYSRGEILGTCAEFGVRRAVLLSRNFDPFGRAAFWAKISKLISMGAESVKHLPFGVIWCSQAFGCYFLFSRSCPNFNLFTHTKRGKIRLFK